MIQAVVFDFDGTLVDSNAIKRAAYYETVASIPGADVFLDALFERGFQGDRHAVFAELGRLLGIATGGLAECYGSLCQTAIRPMLARPSLGDALRRLKEAGLDLFVNSATPGDALSDLFGKSPLAALFDGVHGGPPSKTDNLRTIMARHGYMPAQMVAVGDGEDDRRAAEAVGCMFVTVG